MTTKAKGKKIIKDPRKDDFFDDDLPLPKKRKEKEIPKEIESPEKKQKMSKSKNQNESSHSLTAQTKSNNSLYTSTSISHTSNLTSPASNKNKKTNNSVTNANNNTNNNNNNLNNTNNNVNKSSKSNNNKISVSSSPGPSEGVESLVYPSVGIGSALIEKIKNAPTAKEALAFILDNELNTIHNQSSFNLPWNIHFKQKLLKIHNKIEKKLNNVLSKSIEEESRIKFLQDLLKNLEEETNEWSSASNNYSTLLSQSQTAGSFNAPEEKDLSTNSNNNSSITDPSNSYESIMNSIKSDVSFIAIKSDVVLSSVRNMTKRVNLLDKSIRSVGSSLSASDLASHLKMAGMNPESQGQSTGSGNPSTSAPSANENMDLIKRITRSKAKH